VLVALLVAVSLWATVPGALAQEDPGEPVNIYGTAVDEAGNEIPPGTTINAVVDGERQDSLTVEEAGAFGGPGTFDETLAVNTGAGAEVVFTVDGVDGPTAFETLALGESDDVVEVNLTFPGETFAGSSDPAGLSLSLAETSLDVGNTTAATVTATFQNGTERNVTDVAELESLDTDVATVSNGTVVGEAAGTADIRAEYTVEGATVTDTLAVTVQRETAALVNVSLSLTETSLTGGALTDATVTAAFANGTETEVTDGATVESLDPAVATVTGSAVTGESAGTATIQAVYTAGTVTETDTVELTVTEETAELVGITLALADGTIETGETTAATVTAAFSNGSETAVSDTATLESLDPGVATVNGSAVTGASAGTATIEAAFDGATDTAEVTVEPAAEAVFEVGPLDVPATAVPGEPLTVTATVTNVGEAPGSVTLTYTLAGAETERTLEVDVELDPGSAETVSFSPTAPDSAGDIDHTLDAPADSSTATTTVEPDEGNDTGDDDGTGDDGTGDDGTGDDGSGDDGTGGDGAGDDGTGDDGTGDDGTGDDGTGGDGTGDDRTGDDGTGDDGTGDDGTGDDGTGDDGTGDDGTGDGGAGEDGTGDDGTGDDGTGDGGAGEDGTEDSGTDSGTDEDGGGGDGFGAGFGVLVVLVAVLGLLVVRVRSG